MESENQNFEIRIEAKAKNAVLVKAREELNLNMSNAAKMIGIQPSRLSAYELMKEYPTESMAMKICNFYGLPPEDVFPPELRHVAKVIPSTFIFEKYIPTENLIYLNASKLLPCHNIEDNILNEIYNTNLVDDLLDILDEKERKILKYRFGFDDGKPETLEKVGKKLNLTRERIRQIEKEAIGKIRSSPKYNQHKKDIPSLFEHYSHQKNYFHL